jgi:hypothetical protein
MWVADARKGKKKQANVNIFFMSDAFPVMSKDRAWQKLWLSNSSK